MVKMIWNTDLKSNLSYKKNSFFSSPQRLLNHKVVEIEEKNKSFKNLLRAYWQKYCKKSTIHGVQYIYDPSLRGIERLIWTALVITCIILACIAYLILIERYSTKNLQTVVKNSQYPVFYIPFPAVAVCTHNRINWQKFEQAKAEFLPPSPDETVLEVFTEFVQRMGTWKFGRFNAFDEMEDINLEAIDDINVSKLAKFMAIECEDIFVNQSCYWRKIPFTCCTRFILEQTESGYCLVFNSEISQESKFIKNKLGKQYYPYHSARAGQKTGLSFQIKVNDKLMSPQSKAQNTTKILIKKPDQISGPGYTISPGTAAYFIVRPEITESDDDLHTLNPNERQCYFEDETTLIKYKANVSERWILNNCLNSCHEEHIHKYCNCTSSLFFLSADNTVEECRPSQYRCLAKNNDIFRYDKQEDEDAYFSSTRPGMTCSCLIPCNTVDYITSLTSLPLATTDSNDTNAQIYEVDVHYQSEVLIQYRTSLEFKSIDLIANFGGIFGLCLGASLVSAVELLYYLTFGFGLYLYDNNYFMILKRNLKNLKKNWITGIKNSLKDKYDTDSIALKSPSYRQRHPQHRDNRW